MTENYCQEHECSECCIGMIHRRIKVSEASHLAGEEPRVYFSKRNQFEQSTNGVIMSTFGNEKNDLIRIFRQNGSGANKKIDLYHPEECRHLNGQGLCGDHPNRASSCKQLIPGGNECLKIRRERGKE